MSVIIQVFCPLIRNLLRDLVDVELPAVHLSIREVAIHQPGTFLMDRPAVG